MCTNFSSSLTSFSCRRIFSTLTLASFSDSRSSCVSCSNAWRSRFSFSARVRPAASSSALRRGEGRRGREEERRKRGGGKWEGEKERMKWEGGEGSGREEMGHGMVHNTCTHMYMCSRKSLTHSTLILWIHRGRREGQEFSYLAVMAESSFSRRALICSRSSILCRA